MRFIFKHFLGTVIVESWVKVNFVWQIVWIDFFLRCASTFLNIIFVFRIVFSYRWATLSVFILENLVRKLVIVLVKVDFSVYLQGDREAYITLDKGIVWAHNRVNLTHWLHHFQVVDVDLGWDQVNIPKNKVSMEKYHSFHALSCQVREIVEEAWCNYLVRF